MQSLYECDLIETAPEWAQSLRHVIAVNQPTKEAEKP